MAECLDKDPARRPTARNLLIRLADPSADAESADGRPQVPQPPPVPQFTQPDGGAAAGRSGKGAGRTLALAGGAVAVLAVLVPAVAFSLLKGDPPGPDPTPTASVTSAGTTAPTAPASDGGTSTATSPAGQGGVTIPAAFAGTWKGRVSQPSVLGGELASDVTIVLREGASEGDADYPGWGCTNRLHLSRSDGSVLEFDETVIRNTGGCRGGVVRLTLQGDRLDYESPGDGLFSQTSRGTLRRG